VALTAHATQGDRVGDRERCLAAGMDDYLTKPLDPDRLGQTIAKWIPATTGRPNNNKQTAALGDVSEAQTSMAPVSGPVESPEMEQGPIDYPRLLQRCLGNSGLAKRLVRKLESRWQAGDGKCHSLPSEQPVERRAARFGTFLSRCSLRQW